MTLLAFEVFFRDKYTLEHTLKAPRPKSGIVIAFYIAINDVIQHRNVQEAFDSSAPLLKGTN